MFGFLCGVNFDTKLHQERKLCFHDREITALLPWKWNNLKQAVAPMEVRPSAQGLGGSQKEKAFSRDLNALT